MDALVLLAVAIGLSMDSFAVSLACGASGRHGWKTGARLAAVVGAMHILMSGAGFLIGTAFKDVFSALDHWAAFLLLAYIGGKMILSSRNEEGRKCVAVLDAREMVAIAFATSIDAFGVGMGFALMDVGMLVSILVIGIVAAAFTFAGAMLGRKAGAKYGATATLLGGIVLALIGFKILADHMLG